MGRTPPRAPWTRAFPASAEALSSSWFKVQRRAAGVRDLESDSDFEVAPLAVSVETSDASHASWSRSLPVPTGPGAPGLRRLGGESNWRMLVEEYEPLDRDEVPCTQPRLVFAQTVTL